MNEIYVEIFKIEKHIHQFDFPTPFYSFSHLLILYDATQLTHF
jgi:hypothetical protein